MRGQRILSAVALLILWLGWAAWQHHEYGHEREQAEDGLRRQAHTLETVLVGGIRSHRRLGTFFQQQIEGILEELADSPDVRAVSFQSTSGANRLQAGETSLFHDSSPVDAGEYWRPEGYWLVDQFTVPAQSDRPGSGPGRHGSPGPCKLGDACCLAGNGTALAEAGPFVVQLILDPTHARNQIASAARLRGTLTLAGAAGLACLTLAGLAVVRLIEARARAEVLESETRHLRELEQAAAGLAHETRNPLGVVRGWAQRLAEWLPPQTEQQQSALAVVEECDRVTARINQFLTFARPRQPHTSPVALCSLIDELRSLLEPDLEEKRLEMVCRTDSTLRWLLADRELLRQALFNLLQNAIHFSPKGGRVEVGLARSDAGRARLEIRDNGPGVASAAIPLLFTPYFTTRPGGTGLGLAIVQRIAAAHGWRAGYTPAASGAVFWLDRITLASAPGTSPAETHTSLASQA